jgi:gamma-glutamylputrescine oxidase
MRLLSADQDLARDSYYTATVARRDAFASLEGDAECDVAIVGGGLAGLSASIELADQGYKVVLLEARRVGWGASGRNGGQALPGVACDQPVLESLLGLDEARRVWAMTLESIDLIHARCRRFGIDCDWRPGYLAVAVSARKSRDLHEWQAGMLAKYRHETAWIGPEDLARWISSPRYHSAVYDAHAGHLNPLKYSLGLARAAAGLGVRIHEETTVTRLVPGAVNELFAGGSRVRAAHVLLAGNVYLQGIEPMLERRIMPVGTYIVASQPLDGVLARSLIPSGACVSDTNFVLDYFRLSPDHRMLYGGRVSYSARTPPNLRRAMQRRMARTFPALEHAQIDHAWGGFVDITMNRAPDFGRLSDVNDELNRASNVYYLQGFSGHGLALAGLAGKLVAEAIAGNAARFDTFARIRHRPFPGGPLLRMPALVAGMAYYRLRDLL